MKTILDNPARSSVALIDRASEPAKILAVDDDEHVRRLEAWILQAAGYQVETADGGEVAWRAILRTNYDLLVTDYLMPGASGLALVRQLRVANIAIPVVLVTGTLASLDTKALIRDPWSRAQAFVGKPFAGSELLAAVHGALASRYRDAHIAHLAPA